MLQPDASQGMVADISGTFLLAIFVQATSTLRPPQAIATATLTSMDPPTANFDIQFLDINTRQLVGTTVSYPGITINAVGQFNISIPSLTIVAAANDLATDVTAVNVNLAGTVISSDFYCGTLTGTVQPQNIDLAGSTFGAQRIPAGEIGNALPAPIIDCAHAPTGTGTIDAGT